MAKMMPDTTRTASRDKSTTGRSAIMAVSSEVRHRSGGGGLILALPRHLRREAVEVLLVRRAGERLHLRALLGRVEPHPPRQRRLAAGPRVGHRHHEPV